MKTMSTNKVYFLPETVKSTKKFKVFAFLIELNDETKDFKRDSELETFVDKDFYTYAALDGKNYFYWKLCKEKDFSKKVLEFAVEGYEVEDGRKLFGCEDMREMRSLGCFKRKHVLFNGIFDTIESSLNK